MERRWLLFFLLSLVIIQVFMMFNKPQTPAERRGAAGETTATLARESTGTITSITIAEETSATASAAAASASAPVRGPRMVENTSITIAQHPGEITTVTTSKYAIGVDQVGAVINSWRLLDPGSQSFVKSLETSAGIEMVRRIPTVNQGDVANQSWPLQVSFREANAQSYEDFNDIKWKTKAARESDRQTIAEFESPTIRGIRVEKALLVPEDKYFSKLRVTLVNDSESTVSIFDENNRGLTLRWGPGLVDRHVGDEHQSEAAYDRAVLRVNDGVESFNPAADKDALEADGPIRWAGVDSKFFAALLVPEQPDDAARMRHYYFRTLVPGSHKANIKGYVPPLVMELSTDRFDLPAKGSRTFEYGVYLGPKKRVILKEYKHELETLMFHDSWGFMRAIYLFLTALLNWIYNLVHNFGVAIILLTVIVRLATFPLTQHSIKLQAKTMAEQAKIKPYLEQINEKYKDNPQEKNKQVWKVYQEHGISPFGALRGCVPMLLQLPVFYGLYRVSNDTIDLKGASFMWIKDLSLPDHLFHIGAGLPLIPEWFNLLPILMGGTQVLSTWVASARVPVQDPTQKQIMYIMPLMLTFMLYSMPSGLMLYWIASNIWQIGQTMLTNQHMKHEEAARQQQGGRPTPPPAPPVSAKKDGPARQKKR